MANHESEEFKFYYYSERGLINFFIQELLKLKDDKERTDVIKKILSNIGFEFEYNLFKWFNIVVEPSFGQFGDPDLLILTSTGKGGKYFCFFIEAKRDSLESILKQKNTSNIVCQLINKMKIGESKIVNTNNIQYKKSDGSNNTKILKNEESLNILELILSDGIKNSKLNEYTNFYYISLTSDSENSKRKITKDDVEKVKKLTSKKELVLDEDLELWEKNEQFVGALTYYELADSFPNSDDIRKGYEKSLKYYKHGKDINMN